MIAPRLLIDGAPAKPADLLSQALVNYGAYTSFRVEDGAVRGLDRHLARLQAASAELFGETLDESELRGWMREALGDRESAWLRVNLFSPHIGHRHPSWTGRPSVMIGVFESPSALADRPLRVQPRVHRREAPHLKSVATFGLIFARRAARADGFDDALFVDETGVLSEGTLWNIGFWRGDQVIWPEAPMLTGVTQALLSETFGDRRERIALDDVGGFDAAFLCNSATPACAIAAIGEVAFDPSPERVEQLRDAWESRSPRRI